MCHQVPFWCGIRCKTLLENYGCGCVWAVPDLKHMHESIKTGLQFSSLGLHAMGTLKLMPINCRPSKTQASSESMSTDPMQLPCTLDWGSWDWSCTTAYSRPCEFRILLASGPPPCLWTWWWNSLDSLPQASHGSRPWQTRCFWTKPRWYLRWRVSGKVFVGEICAKQTRKFCCKMSRHISPLHNKPRPPPWPGWKSRFRRFCPTSPSPGWPFQHPTTLPQPLSKAH